MKIVIVNHYDRYEDTLFGSKYFSSKQRAEDYLNKYLKKYKFDRADFEIEEEEIDPDDSWMEE